MRNFELKKRIPFMVAAAAGTFALGLLLNAYYQAGAYNSLLVRNATIGAFISADGKVPVEVTKERLVNLDGTADVSFVPKDRVLELALDANPDIKEVVAPGENPFIPYFVIRPGTIASGFVRDLAERVRNIEGIEDVRYDPNLVAVSEQLARFRTLYRTAFEGLAAAALLIIVWRFVARLIAKDLTASGYLALLATGLAAGILGTLSYYFFGTQMAGSAIVHLPDRYLAYMLLAGIALTFVCESE